MKIFRFNEFILESRKNVWYHGSPNKFDEFKLKKGTLLDTDYTSPIFLSSDKTFAEYYSGHQDSYIYTIELLTDNIMDFRNLPSTYDLLMYEEKGAKKPNISQEYYEIGKKLLNYIDNKFDEDIDIDRLYNNLLDGDYSSIERPWVYDWLKANKYAGAYVMETKSLNLFIFDEKDIKIINVEK